jgi:hypothetical protein
MGRCAQSTLLTGVTVDNAELKGLMPVGGSKWRRIKIGLDQLYFLYLTLKGLKSHALTPMQKVSVREFNEDYRSQKDVSLF